MRSEGKRAEGLSIEIQAPKKIKARNFAPEKSAECTKMVAKESALFSADYYKLGQSFYNLVKSCSCWNHGKNVFLPRDSKI